MREHHILVPYDGSKPSERAFDEALKTAKKDNSKISILTCSWGATIIPFWNVDITLNTKNFSTKIRNLEKKASREKLSFSYYHEKTPYIVASIISHAKKKKIDLIIMGSRNLKGIKKILQGSVSEEIKRHAHCIVKIVT